ncbi:GATA zinc finger-domain-containing protein [Mycena amicta]|nr:GATA zinc finger-domain-containing protein [Mycena amicta]
MSHGKPFISDDNSLRGAFGPYGLPSGLPGPAPAPPSPSPYAPYRPTGQGHAYPQRQPQGYPSYSGTPQYSGYNASQYPSGGQPAYNNPTPSGMVGYAPQPHPQAHGHSHSHSMYAPPAPMIPEIKACANCGATSTPLWRRDPVTHNTLCNACGLYFQQRRSHRPPELIEAEREYQGYGVEDPASEDDDEGPSEGRPQCSHCHTRQTSVWRRNKDGDQVCNACGVYQRLRGKERPLSLRKDKVKPRAKHSH